MDQETLADYLRRATRNFTSRLPEDRVFAIGQALAAELARAHAEQPPRHPDLDPDTIPMADGAPRLTGGGAAGETSEDLFRLGCLLSALALGTPAEPSWRLDGPPEAEDSTVMRRARARVRPRARRGCALSGGSRRGRWWPRPSSPPTSCSSPPPTAASCSSTARAAASSTPWSSAPASARPRSRTASCTPAPTRGCCSASTWPPAPNGIARG